MSSKKSKSSKKISYDRDYQFEDRVNRVFDILRKTNIVTKDNLFKYSHHMNKSISKSRFDILLKLKYIQKVDVVNKRTKEVYEAYQLTERGKTYCNDYLGGNVYASRSIFHDFHQSNYLFDNFSISELETYKHEKELTPPSQVDAHITLQEKMSRPDGQIQLSTGETVFVETITRDYTLKLIRAKVTYAQFHKTRCLYNVL